MSDTIQQQLLNVIHESALANASDIHLKSDRLSYIRNAENQLCPIGPEQLPQYPKTDDLLALLQTLSPRMYDRVSACQSSDISDSVDGSADIVFQDQKEKDFRMRLNAYYDYYGLSLAIRILKNNVPSMSSLGLPIEIQQLKDKAEGLILFYGATGSGKTTAMYSFVDTINHEGTKHIIMLDDPTEIILKSDKSPISQIEVGLHCSSFASGLRSSLREDPNIIAVGELRDQETIATALKAAETGHLVISSIHASSAEEVVDRVLQYFPADEHSQRRNELANSFLAAVGCRLFERIGGGRVAAYETILRIPAITAMLRDGDTKHIQDYMNANNGMQSMAQAKAALQFHHLIK